MILDNVPAHSIEAEQSLIATLIIDNSHFRFCDFLDPEDFYKGGHQKIYRAMRSMHVMKEPIDLVTLTEALHKDGNLELIGGPAYLVNMVDNSPAFNTESYVKIIKECSLTRQVNMKCLEIISSTLSGRELVEKAQADILSVNSSEREDNIKAVKDIVIQHIERLEKANNTRDDPKTPKPLVGCLLGVNRSPTLNYKPNKSMRWRVYYSLKWHSLKF